MVKKNEIGHWPYLAIVAVVAVVGVVFLVMQSGSSEQVSEELPDSIELVDEQGNLAGEAFRSRYRTKSYTVSPNTRTSVSDEYLECMIECVECTPDGLCSPKRSDGINCYTYCNGGGGVKANQRTLAK